MDFEPYVKVHKLVSVLPKSVILGQMTNLNIGFHMVVSVYRLVKILKLAPVPWWISERLIERLLKMSTTFKQPRATVDTFLALASEKPVTMGLFWLNAGGWKHWIDENRICNERYMYGVAFSQVNKLRTGNAFYTPSSCKHPCNLSFSA